MPYETLGTLRSRLRTRLGFSAAGAAAGVNQELLNDFLRDGQVTLYWASDWARLRKYDTVTLGVGQYLIDYPVNANPERIKAISVLRTNVWSPPLRKGIDPEMYTNQDVRDAPHRWEPYEQIELFPKADQIYSVRIFYVKNLGRFTQDNDLATVDSDLIFKLAIARAKAHYRHPDAQAYVDEANNLLVKLKGKNWGKDVFAPHNYTEEDPLPKPVVV